ncbi:hypothetical protein SYNPS1DRAFT_21098 [Syncephalis pseudoplumigaleata]|uniref:Uncharacterized protein n=1 Tax=Syncephalis pseudoplumigaleata TaxID=1712513 RepID=A0A4P9Z4K1_9FUNG|nr:hypothetical protein SYNPS1DRAFT_21098 [Syncephalis pseudoplumigaleata]|eukprot:RKP27348.1 hypothetical protein SYNPS1DRAFT_21098 [Syncephalis pseudoplumigaleata]
MSLFGQLRRYIVPALRLARFLAVWGSITVTLWILALPVIAREVFKGLLRRNAARNNQTPWTQSQSQSQSHQQHQQQQHHHPRPQRSARPSSRRYSAAEAQSMPRQPSASASAANAAGAGFWSRSSSYESNGAYADEPACYHERSGQRSGRRTPPPKYTPAPTPPSPPRSTSPPQPRAHPVSSGGWHM